MGRYNLSFVNKSLSTTYGWDKTQIGAIISVRAPDLWPVRDFQRTVSDKIGRPQIDADRRCGHRHFQFFVRARCLCRFPREGGHSSWAISATVWALNSYFQSFSALSLIKVNASWFHISERGVFSAIFGSMIQGGRMLIYAVGRMLVTYSALAMGFLRSCHHCGCDGIFHLSVCSECARGLWTFRSMCRTRPAGIPER